MVKRAGNQACSMCNHKLPPLCLPAHYTTSRQSRLGNPSRAANAFFGGFRIGIKESEGDVVKVARYSVDTASFASE